MLTYLPYIVALMLLTACGLLLHLLMKKSEDIGSLKTDNKTEGKALEDVEKANAARNDPVELDRVREQFKRDK